MIRKFKKFTALSFEEKKLFFEAFYTLGMMRFKLLRVPFKSLVASRGSQAQNNATIITTQQVKVALQVGRMIILASAHTPWESTCLVQALCAQEMLKKQGIPGTIHVGVMKDKNNTELEIKAHAWTQCDKEIITGGGELGQYTELSAFRWL